MVISIRVNYSNMSLKKIITMSFCEIIYFFYIYTNFLNYLKNCHTLISSGDYCLMACNLWLTASKYLAPFVAQYVKSRDAPEIKRKRGYAIREIP